MFRLLVHRVGIPPRDQTFEGHPMLAGGVVYFLHGDTEARRVGAAEGAGVREEVAWADKPNSKVMTGIRPMHRSFRMSKKSMTTKETS
mmetsp:Transcript_23222/g.36321  ORF Transcript_23222/g.36321 Transcript_23222/m.36321 type:complete len:88 (-) Transcript_23222:620-883(-)